MTSVLSYGGGRQTVAMCVLVATGKLPCPDYVVIADTGYEAQSTWDYLDAHMRPLLAPLGLDVIVASHDLATVDLYARDGQTLLPAFTATGKLRTFCSSEWKAAVLHRCLRGLGVTRATHWIGFSLDEAQRIKHPIPEPGPWPRTYPLIDLMLTKQDCIGIIERVGLPLPAKSACYMCPHRSNDEWRHIRDAYPDQWRQAIAIDEDIRANDERGGLFLHSSRVPLAMANIDADDRREPSRQCGLGLCMI